MRIRAPDVQLLVIDFQERLFNAMAQGAREDALRRTTDLQFVFRELGLPILVTEQYPKGLGLTLEPLRGDTTFEKSAFSACEETGFAERLVRKQVIVCGMETHVCVALTTQDLLAAGYEVAVIPDACLSRRDEDRAAGIELCRQSGAAIVPVETALFSLIGRAGSPLFKEVSRRIR